MTLPQKPLNRLGSPLGASGCHAAPLFRQMRKTRQRVYSQALHGGCVALVEILLKTGGNATFLNTLGDGGGDDPLKLRWGPAFAAVGRPQHFTLDCLAFTCSRPESPP